MTTIKEYNFTKHADERLMERFLVPKSGRQAFITNFLMKGGKFIEKGKDNLDLYRANDIIIVADPANQTIVTVYHKDQKRKNPVDSLEDDFLADLAEQSRVLKKRVVRDNTDNIEHLVYEVSELTKPLRNTHDTVVDSGFESLYSKVSELKEYLDKLDSYRKSADKVRKGEF